MTEAQAYDVLGWPHEGKGFILPLAGRPDSDYVVAVCMCGIASVAIKGHEDLICNCGRELAYLEF